MYLPATDGMHARSYAYDGSTNNFFQIEEAVNNKQKKMKYIDS